MVVESESISHEALKGDQLRSSQAPDVAANSGSAETTQIPIDGWSAPPPLWTRDIDLHLKQHCMR